MSKWPSGVVTYADLLAPPRLDTVTSSYEAAATAQRAFVEAEARVATRIEEKVLHILADSAGMDARTFLDFIRFLSEDPELQERFIGWRAKRRVLG